jgi:hypothetical protein
VTSEKVCQIDRYGHSDSACWGWSHTDHVNLRFGLIQVAICKLTEDFRSWPIRDRDLIGPFIRKRLRWANRSMLTGGIAKVKLFRKRSD